MSVTFLSQEPLTSNLHGGLKKREGGVKRGGGIRIYESMYGRKVTVKVNFSSCYPGGIPILNCPLTYVFKVLCKPEDQPHKTGY